MFLTVCRVVVARLSKNRSFVKVTKQQIGLINYYSTTIYTDVFDAFIDAAIKPKLRLLNESSDRPPMPITNHEEIETLLKLDQLDFSNKCPNIITISLQNKRHKDVIKVLEFCMDKKIKFPSETLSQIAENFTNISYNDGLDKLAAFCKIIDPTEYKKHNQFLYHFSKSAWIGGDVNGCLSFIENADKEFPELIQKTKHFLCIIVEDTVELKSEKELWDVFGFIRKFCHIHCDYYLLAVLWNCLFQSKLSTDRQLATDLLVVYKEISVYIKIMCVPMAKSFLSMNKIDHLHSLLHLLIELKMMEQYGTIIRYMFDVYCLRGDKNRCSEIVRSAAILNTSLREDQYNKFISLTVCNNPSEKIVYNKLKEYKFKF